MALIRQANAAEIARSAVVLDLGDLQRQATAIVADAQARASAIATAAKAERERIVAGAAEQGRAEGLAAGREQGRREGAAEGRAAALAEMKERLGRLEAAWDSALAGFQGSREDILRAAQRDVLKLSLAIAERITKRTIRCDPQVAAAQLEAVLGVVVRPSELTVRIHPDDREVIAAALPVLLARFAQVRHVELLDDPTLERGSCIAATRGLGAGGGAGSAGGGGLDRGEIDASIATQLDRIVAALLGDEDAPAATGGAGEPGDAT